MLELHPIRDPWRDIQWLEGLLSLLVGLFAAFLTYQWWVQGADGWAALLCWLGALLLAWECRRTWRLRVQWARQQARVEALVREIQRHERRGLDGVEGPRLVSTDVDV